jgi:hypothetical protein
VRVSLSIDGASDRKIVGLDWCLKEIFRVIQSKIAAVKTNSRCFTGKGTDLANIISPVIFEPE